MFNTNPEAQERGQVGIGTLIVFIALVLVAAIAAGVLINTAGFLQSQAESTGQQSTDQVSNNLNALSVNATSSSGDNVQELGVLVSLGPGSDAVDLSEMTIEYVGPAGADTLVAGTDALTTPGDDVVTADATVPTFGIETADGSNTDDGAGGVSGSLSPPSAPVLTDSSQRLRIIIPYATGGSTVLDSGELSPGDNVTLTLTTADGSQQNIDITIPDPLSSGDNRV